MYDLAAEYWRTLVQNGLKKPICRKILNLELYLLRPHQPHFTPSSPDQTILKFQTKSDSFSRNTLCKSESLGTNTLIGKYWYSSACIFSVGQSSFKKRKKVHH